MSDDPRLPTSPAFWRSPLRGLRFTSVLGLVLLAGVTVLFVTGLVSYAAYNPDLARVNDQTPDKGILGFYLFSWPTSPYWLYRLNQGVHVTLGLTLIPVLLAKLWSVVPKLFALPPARSVAHALERVSLLLLVGGVLFEFVTGVLNIQLDYLFPGSFYRLHFYGAWVFFSAFVVHTVLKLPTALRNVRRMREERAQDRHARGGPAPADGPDEPAGGPDAPAGGHAPADGRAAAGGSAPGGARGGTGSAGGNGPAGAGVPAGRSSPTGGAGGAGAHGPADRGGPADGDGPAHGGGPADGDGPTHGDDLVSPAPAEPTVSRRGALWFVGGGSLLLFATTVGQNFDGALRRTALLAPHGWAEPGSGPDGFQVNKTAAYRGITAAETDDEVWRLTVTGRTGTVRLSRADLLAMDLHSAALPIACVEGWSTSDQWWRGVRLRDLAALVGDGGDPPDVMVESLQRRGAFRAAALRANQVADGRSLLALYVNGEPLSPDHGFPARTIVPAAPGVMNTKWVARLTFGDL